MMRDRYEDGAAMAVGPDRIFAILVGSGPALGPTLTEILQHHSDGDGSLESEARALRQPRLLCCTIVVRWRRR